MILPHWDLLGQCRVVADGLPVENWDQLSRSSQWAEALIAKWTIQKAFEAALLARGISKPDNASLVALGHSSGISLNTESQECLEEVDRAITSEEPTPDSDLDIFLRCCRLARGVVSSVSQELTMADVVSRTKGHKPAT